jgi:hypothetical protein
MNSAKSHSALGREEELLSLMILERCNSRGLMPAGPDLHSLRKRVILTERVTVGDRSVEFTWLTEGEKAQLMSRDTDCP